MEVMHGLRTACCQGYCQSNANSSPLGRACPFPLAPYAARFCQSGRAGSFVCLAVDEVTLGIEESMGMVGSGHSISPLRASLTTSRCCRFAASVRRHCAQVAAPSPASSQAAYPARDRSFGTDHKAPKDGRSRAQSAGGQGAERAAFCSANPADVSRRRTGVRDGPLGRRVVPPNYKPQATDILCRTCTNAMAKPHHGTGTGRVEGGEQAANNYDDPAQLAPAEASAAIRFDALVPRPRQCDR